MPTRYIKPLLLLVVIPILLRLPLFLSGFINIDENEYTIAAQKILAGGFPYRDVLIYQPPIIYYIYALGFILSGGIHIWSAQILSIIAILGTMAGIYSFTRQITTKSETPLYAAALYGLFSTTFLPMDMLAANCELFMMLPLTWAFSYIAKPRSTTTILTAGMLASLGFLTKFQGGIILPVLGLYLLVSGLSSRRIVATCVDCLILLIGFLIPIAMMAAYFYAGDALTYAIEAWRYILLYAKGPPQNDPLYLFLKFITRSSLFILPALPFWIMGVVQAYHWSRKRHRTSPAQALLPIWLVASLCPILAGGRMYFHYYYVILPPVFILAAVWLSHHWTTTRPRLRTLVIAWSLFQLVSWTAYAYWKPFKPLGTKDQWIHVSDYLREHATHDETLFIWGYCPQLYIASGLPAATRFTTSDYLTGRSPMTAGLEYDPTNSTPPSSLTKLLNDFRDPDGVVWFDTSANQFPKAWDYLKIDFEKQLPTYIIDTSPSNYRRYGRYPMSHYPLMEETISHHYTKVESIAQFDIYRLSDDR